MKFLNENESENKNICILIIVANHNTIKFTHFFLRKDFPFSKKTAKIVLVSRVIKPRWPSTLSYEGQQECAK